jgi:hypothetical protein
MLFYLLHLARNRFFPDFTQAIATVFFLSHGLFPGFGDGHVDDYAQANRQQYQNAFG